MEVFSARLVVYLEMEASAALSVGYATFGNTTRDVELSDLNGDGHLDFVAVSEFGDGIAEVRLGAGDGTFGASESFIMQLQDEETAFVGDILLRDLNGDGVLDLTTMGQSNQRDGQAVVRLGTTREGIAPILDFSLETQADALQALAPLERKLQSLSEQRGTIGAFQSRLQSALNTLSATSENYAAAESRIKDADIAFESSQLTRLNILQQAAAAVLGQAHQQPALALQLLN